MNSGYIKLWRKLMKSDMYLALSSTQRDVMIQCLMLANHAPKKWEWNGQVFECQPGQFVTSLDSLKKKCGKGTSLKMIRVALSKLKKWEFMADEGAKTGRLITIINWDTYQNNYGTEGKEEGKGRAKAGQRQGKGRATTKNEENDKNVKNIYGEFQNVLLTDKEIEKLHARFGEVKTKALIERLSSGIASKGYKYKSHYATILTWVEKDISKGSPGESPPKPSGKTPCAKCNSTTYTTRIDDVCIDCRKASN